MRSARYDLQEIRKTAGREARNEPKKEWDYHETVLKMHIDSSACVGKLRFSTRSHAMFIWNKIGDIDQMIISQIVDAW